MNEQRAHDRRSVKRAVNAIVVVLVVVIVILCGVLLYLSHQSAMREDEARDRGRAAEERAFCIADREGAALAALADALKGAPTATDRNEKLDRAFDLAVALQDVADVCASDG